MRSAAGPTPQVPLDVLLYAGETSQGAEDPLRWAAAALRNESAVEIRRSPFRDSARRSWPAAANVANSRPR